MAREALILAQNATSNAVAAAMSTQEEYSKLDQNRMSWLSASDAVRDRQRALDDAIRDLSLAQQNAGVDTSLNTIKLRELRKDIEDQQKKIEELEKDGSSTEITSLVNGKVTQVNISPGNQAEPDEVLMIIEVSDRGYSLSFPVTSEQASRVSIGDQAEVDRGYFGWGEELRATLTGIRNDPKNPVTGRILHFAVTGDVESGTQLNVILAQRSESYSVIVPNSAIRTDTNGDFVLVLMSRSSPLGTRYIATRADVNIVASDDTHTAVGGALTNWDFVITTSTAPIDPGMQVRLVDNP